MTTSIWRRSILMLGGLTLMANSAMAVPHIQVYIEGATYDPDSESWVTGSASFNLWVVGAHDPIEGVKLAVAVSASESGSISFTPTMSTLVCGSSNCDTGLLPDAPTYLGLSADGAVPMLSDGSYLPTHGIYGPGVRFHEYLLGDFGLAESVGDYIDGFPTSWPHSGEIKAYTVSVSGYTAVHFDAYDHIAPDNDAWFAPFSHDGFGGGGEPVPEPATLLLLGGGLTTIAARRRLAKK
jgi:hypothetical protein